MENQRKITTNNKGLMIMLLMNKYKYINEGDDVYIPGSSSLYKS